MTLDVGQLLLADVSQVQAGIKADLVGLNVETHYGGPLPFRLAVFAVQSLSGCIDGTADNSKKTWDLFVSALLLKSSRVARGVRCRRPWRIDLSSTISIRGNYMAPSCTECIRSS